MVEIEKVIGNLEDDKHYLFKMIEDPNYRDADRRKTDDVYLYCDIKEAIQTIRELGTKNDEYEEQLESYGETIDELNERLTDAFEKIGKLQEDCNRYHECGREYVANYGKCPICTDCPDNCPLDKKEVE